MLSWDEYNTEEAITSVKAMPTPKVSVEEPAPAPAASTTTSLDSAVAADAEAADIMATNVERAKAAIDQIDVAPGLEELEMGAARVSVDEKALRASGEVAVHLEVPRSGTERQLRRLDVLR